MKSITFFSIITINRNNESGLSNTIKSVLSQTFPGYEYIIIDGDSDDGSIDVINKFKDHFTYWVSEPDNGIYAAMNKGVARARGEYCLFLNSGDMLSDQSILERVFNRRVKADLVYGNQIRVNGRMEKIIKPTEKLDFYYFYTEFLPHNCTFIKRELFKIVGLYNESYRIASDHEFFMLAFCKHNCSVEYINDKISYMEEGGVSNNPSFSEIVSKERDLILNDHFPAFIKDYKFLYKYRYYSMSKRIKRFIKSSISWCLR